MDTQNIKQRVKDEPVTSTTTSNADDDNNGSSTKRDKRLAMAKRGLRSLVIAVSLPLFMTFLTTYSFGSGQGYGNAAKSTWLPSLRVMHITCMASSFLMGLSAWLVWAEGGFHRKPAALWLYLAQLGLSLAWDPIVFGMGAKWVGLVGCVAMFGALVGCSRVFREVNRVAGDLVKPCMAWTAVLGVVNLKLVSR